MKNLSDGIKNIFDTEKGPPGTVGAKFNNVNEKDYRAKWKPLFEQSYRDVEDGRVSLQQWVSDVRKQILKAANYVMDIAQRGFDALKRFLAEVGRRTRMDAGQTITSHQVKYKPTAVGQTMNYFSPIEFTNAMETAKSDLVNEVGNINEFVRGELAYETIDDLSNALGPEQIEAVAFAIREMKAGKGFVLGDETGVGKGRVVASMLRWGRLNGRVPVFV